MTFGRAQFFKINNPQTDVWYVKPFWRKVWGSMNGVGLGSLGATTLYGEYGQYNDQFASNAGSLCGAFDGLFGTNVDHFCNSGAVPNFTVPSQLEGLVGNSVFVTGSEVQRWGLGVVQEIDAAAMHVFARWQHQEARYQPDWVPSQYPRISATSAIARSPTARSMWARASKTGICSRSAASSSSKPTHQNAYPSEAAPLRGGFFFVRMPPFMAKQVSFQPHLVGERRCLARGDGQAAKRCRTKKFPLILSARELAPKPGQGAFLEHTRGRKVTKTPKTTTRAP